MVRYILNFLLLTGMAVFLQTAEAEDIASHDQDGSPCIQIEYNGETHRLGLCVKYGQGQYAFDLESKDLLRWKMDPASFEEAVGSGPCIAVAEDLCIKIPCALLSTNADERYGFTLKHDINDKWVWSLDPESIIHNPFEPADTGNLSQMDWIDAYDAFHKQISVQYAFGEWKGIDWEGLDHETRPKIVKARQENDETAYSTALREYTASIPDGHIDISIRDLEALVKKNKGGSYGMGINPTDTGKVIASIITEGGAASEAGVEVGDEIVEWNGVPISDAVSATSLLWRLEGHSIATDEHRKIEAYRMLVLDPVDTLTELKFIKPDGAIKTATLKASDDGGVIREGTGLWNRADMTDIVKYRVLDSGFGYIMLSSLQEMDGSTKNISENFKKAMSFLIDMNVPGIVLDLRGNGGGSDFLAAELSGYFYSETVVYEYQSFYNRLTGEFENILTDDDDKIVGRNKSLNIEPLSLNFSGPAVAIVNPTTASSAEGVAMAIQNLPQGHVTGFYGTNGSFGMTGGKVILPCNISVEFPFGRSLDRNRVIQLDSRDGHGGVVPDLRIPMTAQRVIKYARGEDVELEYAEAFLRQML